MEQHTLNVLEFDKIIEQLTELAGSELGRQRCAQLRCSSDLEEAMSWQQQTTSAVRLLLKKGLPAFSGLTSLAPFLERSKTGTSLTTAQLLRVARFLRNIRLLYAFVSEEEAAEELLPRLMRNLRPLDKLEKKLSEAILGEEEVSDQASPELAHIRHSIRKAQAAVRRILEQLMQRHANDLQEQLITLRGTRYVLPVKESHRSSLPGIVHDSSGSGQTLFIEPLEVVEANNKIREWQLKEREEIERILLRLSQDCLQEKESLLWNEELAASIDFIFSKGRLSLQQKANPIRLNQEGRLRLLQARHPLLDPAKVVPQSFALGGSCRSLLITGPNTGGKTVALKTCGLLSLMAAAGLHIPAGEGSELAIFDRILVDIGDEQSLEANLSTFSSHMKQLIHMCEQASPSTLILSDELGSGTDPLEGAALARAILDHWKQAGAVTMATTHYREIKKYALTEEGVENACCELDPVTLRPTYRLLMGAVGVSHAFSISERLGLAEDIVAKAKSLISTDDQAFERLMEELTQSKMAAETALEQAQKDSQEAKEALQKARRLEEELQSKKQTWLEKAREEAKHRYENGLKEMEQLLKQLEQLAEEEERKKLAKIRKQKQQLAADLHGIQQEIARDSLADLYKGEEVIQLQVGQRVYVPAMQVEAVVVNLPDAKGLCKIASGNIQLQVPAVSLRPLKEKPQEKQRSSLSTKASYYQQRQKSRGGSATGRQQGAAAVAGNALPLELYLLGETTADAVVRLDKHIDHAQRNHLKEIRIIHGKGTGALRKAVQDFLKKDSRIASFQLAAYGEGDSGVTVAQLK